MRFEPMLAHPTKKERVNFNELDYYVQPKLDGIRCYITKDGMFTRKHNPINSAPHIFEELKPFFKDYPEIVLDGELYNHSLKNDFEKIVSLVRKQNPTQEQLQESFMKVEFHNYDMFDSYNPLVVFSHRQAWMKSHGLSTLLHTVPVETLKVVSDSQVQNINKAWLKAGYEGSMLRADVEYQQKRTWHLQKVKQFKDEEAVIIDYVEGKGKLQGKLGKFMMKTAEGVVFGCPMTANTHAQRQEAWETRDMYIGKEATFTYFEKTKRGAPRFPVFKALRNYE